MDQPSGADQRESYEQSADDVAASFGTSLSSGLSSSDAHVLLKRYGPNEITTELRLPSWRRFCGQFKDTLVLLLLAAAGISCGVWAVERDAGMPYEGMVIITITSA